MSTWLYLEGWSHFSGRIAMQAHWAIALVGLFFGANGGFHGDVPDGFQTSQAGLFPAGQHHLIVVPSGERAKTLFVIDWGAASRPSDLVAAQRITRISLENSNQDLVLYGTDGPMVRYTVREDTKPFAGESVVPVIGISSLTDPLGFSRSVLASGVSDDAFDRVRSARSPVEVGPR